MPEFKIMKMPSYCSLQKDNIEIKDKEIEPFEIESLNLNVQALKPGTYALNPQVIYLNSEGEEEISMAKSIGITVHHALQAKIGEESISVAVLPRRVPTGFNDLDVLLLGGIPENFAVVLISQSFDENKLIIKEFLETGAKSGETTCSITADPHEAIALAKDFPSNFYLFFCNLRADALIPDLPNVFKLKGVENLTDIDIALTKFFRATDLSRGRVGTKRACIEIVSDVLLQHHAVIARKWFSSLLSALKTQGFSTLAMINPAMHPSEELQAILGLFDGEIRITEADTERTMRVHRLYGQKYMDREIPIKI